jgi:hypothetical protein
MQIDLQIGGENGQYVKSGELTPIPAGQAPEGVEGAYRVDATGDIVMQTPMGGFVKWNGDGDGSWQEWTPPTTGDWSAYSGARTEWTSRPDVMAINAEQGTSGGGFINFADNAPWMIPALFSAGTSAAIGAGSTAAQIGADGAYTYTATGGPTTLSQLGSTIADKVASIPSSISNAVSSGVDSLSNLFSGGANTGLTEFLAQDAAQLAQQGIRGAQLEAALIQSGADAMTAADIAQLVGQGITDVGQLTQAISQNTGTLSGAATGSPVTQSAVSGASTSGAGTKTAAGAQALKNIVSGKGTLDDWTTLGGAAAPALLSMYASGQQSEALEEVARMENERYQQNFALGAPSRARYEASFADGFDITRDPALKAAMEGTSTTLLNRLSTQGNPFGNPSGVAEANKYVLSNVALPYLQNYRTQNANTGGYSAFNTSAASGPNMQPTLSAINADMNVWNAAGAGAADIFTPKTDFQDLWKKYGPQMGLK